MVKTLPLLSDFYKIKINLKKIIPLALIGLVIFLINWGLYRRLAPSEPFDTFVYPYEQPFENVAIHRWFSNSGEWQVANGLLTQKESGIDNAVVFIPHWLVVEQPYQLSVDIKMSDSSGMAGVIFNAQYPDIYSAAQQVVVEPAGNQYQLNAGILDQTEGLIIQDTAETQLSKNTFHIDLLVYEDSYTVLLDGKKIIEERPLRYQNGLVGLTASGVVSFDNIYINTIDKASYAVNLEPVETVPEGIASPNIGDMVYTSNFAGGTGSAGWVPIAGDWKIVDGYLTQQDPTGFDFGIGYEPRSFQSYMLQISLKQTNGIGAGVLFNMPSPYQINGAQMVRFADSGNGVFWGYYTDGGEFVGQGYSILPVQENTDYTIKVISGESAYSVFINNQQVASDVLLMSKSGYIGLITARCTASFGLVDVSELLVDPLPSETQMNQAAALSNESRLNETAAPSALDVDWSAPLYIDSRFYKKGFFSNSSEAAWIPVKGHWQIKNNQLVQTDRGGYDFAVGYSGEVFQNYQIDVPLTHAENPGGGVLFNMPNPDSLEWASMVRYSDREDKLMWGYYDGDGKFQGQGSAPVDAPGLSQHVISIISQDTTYDIVLDGQSIAQGVPLTRNSGYIGLVTSRSSVSFGPISITGGNNSSGQTDPGQIANPLIENMNIINGSWEINGNSFTQSSPDFNDFILSTGVSGSVYTLQTTITLPKDPQYEDAGGGVIFHMPDANSRKDAQLVRLSGGGKGIFWGYFNDTENFIGQGWASFDDYPGILEETPDGARVYEIKVVVYNDTYEVFINNQLIASDIKLIQQDGYIGLLAYRGPVTFSNIELSLGDSH